MASIWTSQNTSSRGMAMVLALASAVVLSPLYIRRKNVSSYEITRLSAGGLVLPVVLAGLIIAIKTTSSSPSSSSMSPMQRGSNAASIIPSADPSWVLRIGSSSWGLAAILVMLMLILSWQDSVQEFFWR